MLKLCYRIILSSTSNFVNSPCKHLSEREKKSFHPFTSISLIHFSWYWKLHPIVRALFLKKNLVTCYDSINRLWIRIWLLIVSRHDFWIAHVWVDEFWRAWWWLDVEISVWVLLNSHSKVWRIIGDFQYADPPITTFSPSSSLEKYLTVHSQIIKKH